MKWTVLLVFCTMIAYQALAELRIWTTRSGQTVEAEYVADVGKKVTLKTSDGRTLKVDISSFCEEDLNYILLQKPPRLDINAKKSLSRRETGTDYDDRSESLQFEVTLKKATTRPYPGIMRAYLYVMGEDVVRKNTYLMLDAVSSEFELTKSNGNTHEFHGESILLEYDDNDAAQYGSKYKGYLIFVRDEKGRLIATKSSYGKFEENLGSICMLAPGERFDKSFRSANSANRTSSPLAGADGKLITRGKSNGGTFASHDGNGDGEITMAEFVAAKKKMATGKFRKNPTIKQFKKRDRDKNGVLTTAEFN